MMKVAIIDDEQKAREVLKRILLEADIDTTVVGEAGAVESAYTMLLDTSPEVVFLDVEMLDGTGFDLLEKLESIPFHVIFTTAYDQYAIRAFKYSAIDYLLKPIALEELEAAIGRATKEAPSDGTNNLVKTLLENMKQAPKRMTINSDTKLEVVEIAKIVSIHAEGAYAQIVLNDERKILASKSLNHFTDLLSDDTAFFRISINHTINTNYIHSYNKKTEEVMLHNNTHLKVARRRKKAFLAILKNL